MTESNAVNNAVAVMSLPKRWLINIVAIQEKKNYNFSVIIIFAVFVALMRFLMEFILMHRPIFSINISLINFVTFYLQAIYIYTLILSFFIPNFKWRKTIHLVLIGVFLGILPPVIDSLISGVGNFNYNYIKSFSDWRLFLYNKEADLPAGEVTILYLTIFFTALIVYIKTANLFKSIAAFVVSYGFVLLYAMLQPILATTIDQTLQVSAYYDVKMPADFMGFKGFSFPAILSFLQIVTTIIIYLILNPKILFKLFRRLNHAVPVALTCLLGYSLFRTIDAYAAIITIMVFYGVVVAIVQNDFFDKEEDHADGREFYLDKDDVAFFNTTFILMIGLLLASGNICAYMLLLFLIVSYIYNYDFYRGKKYFPANYKIEGVWGLSAFLAGIGMAVSVTYFFAGDILLIDNPTIRGATVPHMNIMLEEVWTSKTILITFLVFGGWSILSVIKDYKDIESDRIAGIQTAYTLLLKKGKSIETFHKVYSLLLSVLMLTPLLWLISIGANMIFVGALVLLCVLFFWSITKEASNKTVERSLVVVNLYLFVLVLAGHFSHL